MFNFLQVAIVHLALCLLAAAAPVSTQSAKPWQAGTGGGIVGIIVLVLDIIAWVEILKSNRPPLHKFIWCLVVFLFPIVGMVVYYLFSNREAHNSGGYQAIGS